MSIIVEALFLAFTFVCYKGFRFGFIVSRGCLPLGYPGFGGGKRCSYKGSPADSFKGASPGLPSCGFTLLYFL